MPNHTLTPQPSLQSPDRARAATEPLWARQGSSDDDIMAPRDRGYSLTMEELDESIQRRGTLEVVDHSTPKTRFFENGDMAPWNSDDINDLRVSLMAIANDPRLTERFDRVERDRKLWRQALAKATDKDTYIKLVPVVNVAKCARDTRYEAGRTRVLKNLRDSHTDPFVHFIADALAREHWTARNTGVAETALSTVSSVLSVAGGAGAALSIPAAAFSTFGGASAVAASSVDSAIKSGASQGTIAAVNLATRGAMAPQPHPLLPDKSASAVQGWLGPPPDAMRDPAKVHELLAYLGEPSLDMTSLADAGVNLHQEVGRLTLKNRLGAGSNEDLAKREPTKKQRGRLFKRAKMDEFLDDNELEFWRTLKKASRRKDADGDTMHGLPPLQSDQVNTLALLWKAEGLFASEKLRVEKHGRIGRTASEGRLSGMLREPSPKQQPSPSIPDGWTLVPPSADERTQTASA